MRREVRRVMQQTQENILTDEISAMEAQAAEQNARNAYCAVGCGGGAAPEFLSPTQVRSMTRDEVHDNYALIIESMKHWH